MVRHICGKACYLKHCIACSQWYTIDSIFWWAQMMCVLTINNFPPFVKPNIISNGPTNWLLRRQLRPINKWPVLCCRWRNLGDGGWWHHSTGCQRGAICTHTSVEARQGRSVSLHFIFFLHSNPMLCHWQTYFRLCFTVFDIRKVSLMKMFTMACRFLDKTCICKFTYMYTYWKEIKRFENSLCMWYINTWYYNILLKSFYLFVSVHHSVNATIGSIKWNEEWLYPSNIPNQWHTSIIII